VDYGSYVGRPRQKVFRVDLRVPGARNAVYAEATAASEHEVHCAPGCRRSNCSAASSCRDILQCIATFDRQNRRRQDDLQLERKLMFMTWWKRANLSIVEMCVVDA
jgi:hypothetical protein